MLQETMDELVDRQRQVPGLGGLGILVAESDEIVIERDESIVGESDSKDVGSQVSKSGMAGSNRTDIDNPVLLPDFGRGLMVEVLMFEGMAKHCAKDFGESRSGQKELLCCRHPAISVFGEATAGNDHMNVRVVSQIASPGLQDTDYAEASADPFGIPGQLLERFCSGGHEDAVKSLLMSACQGS